MSFHPSDVRIVVHGSFRKHFDHIVETIGIFTAAGFTVLAPKTTTIVGYSDGFTLLDGEHDKSPAAIEGRYLHTLKRLGSMGFSYFVSPRGYVGRATSYKWGVAQQTNVRCYFSQSPLDHPAYIVPNSVWTAKQLVAFILEHYHLPGPQLSRNDYVVHHLWQRLVGAGTTIAVSGIIELESSDPQPPLLFVKTYKWGGRYSLIGEKVQRGERLHDALIRGIAKETILSVKFGRYVATFDQFAGSGFHQAYVPHVFCDYVAKTSTRAVQLDDEAESYVWMPGVEAPADLPLEPNARHTLQQYLQREPTLQ